MLLKGNWMELLQVICWNLTKLVCGTDAIAQNPQVCTVCVKFTRGTQETKCTDSSTRGMEHSDLSKTFSLRGWKSGGAG